MNLLSVLGFDSGLDAPFLIAGKESFSRGRILRMGACVCRRLIESGAGGGQVILSSDNGAGFAAGLVGCWMAGAGLKPGTAVGSTDEIGWKANERPIPWHDFHATVLHLFGIDHEQLTFYHNGIQRRLTNVHGEVVKELLA